MTTRSTITDLISGLRDFRGLVGKMTEDEICELAMDYLLANNSLIEKCLTHVYTQLSEEERRKLSEEHLELHSSAIGGKFYDVASLRQLTEMWADPRKKFMVSLTDDHLDVLIRALEYAKYCDVDLSGVFLNRYPVRTRLTEHQHEN